MSLSILVFSCSGEELSNSDLYQEEIPQKISDFIDSNENYSMFNNAIEGSDIQDWLANQENITLFAPSNAAFNNYLQENGYATINDIPQDYLKELLKNHVITSEIVLGDLESASELLLETMAQTQFQSSSHVMSIITNDSGLKINGITINTPDQFFVNGVVHAVDQVVELSTAHTFINESKQFNSFKNLIGQSNNAAEILEVLNRKISENDSSELTIFAPDNAAVEYFMSNLVTTNSTNSTGTEVINFAVRTQVSSYDNLEVDELTNGLNIQTLGATVSTTVAGNNEVSFKTSPFSEVVKLKSSQVNSIQTSNGILLLTEKVLH